MVGTGMGAGRRVAFVDGEGSGDPLGVKFEGCLAGAESVIELAGKRYRTDFDAVTAGRTFCQIDKAGFLMNRDLKIALFARDAFKLSLGDKVDIEMLADLDQFG